MEDLHSNDHAPEITGQKTDIKESSACQTEHERGTRVEDRKQERVSHEITTNIAIPDSAVERRTVEYASLGAINKHTPKTQLPHDLIKWSFRNQEFFSNVTEAVESCACEGKEVAFKLVTASDAAGGRALSYVVAAEQDADAANADEDAHDLGRVVANAKDDEGDYDDNYDGPEIYELGGEDCGI